MDGPACHRRISLLVAWWNRYFWVLPLSVSFSLVCLFSSLSFSYCMTPIFFLSVCHPIYLYLSLCTCLSAYLSIFISLSPIIPLYLSFIISTFLSLLLSLSVSPSLGKCAYSPLFLYGCLSLFPVISFNNKPSSDDIQPKCPER